MGAAQSDGAGGVEEGGGAPGGAGSGGAADGEDGVRHLFLGIDIGGTTISVGLVDEAGVLQGGPGSSKAAQSRIKVAPLGDDHDPGRVALRVRALAEALLDDVGCSMASVAAAGVCTPGVMDTKRGVVNSAANLKGWQGVPICDLIAGALDLPRAAVVLENDTNAALLAEVWVGAAVGRENVVLMTLGTGIGGAIMCDGRLLRGSKGQAGEIGHSILVPDGRAFGGAGVRGIFEAYASASAVAQRCAEGGGPPEGSALRREAQAPPPDCEEVFRRAEEGDAYASELVKETARCLAIGCINCCRTVDPDMIIFSGGMAQAGEFLLAEVRAQFEAYHWNIEPVRVEIIQAAAGSYAGVVGAAFSAKQRGTPSGGARAA